VEKFCRAVQATDDNITRRVRFACWITKATNTCSEYVILFLGNYGYANAYVLRYVKPYITSVVFNATFEL
jgi:hypothetical protein